MLKVSGIFLISAYVFKKIKVELYNLLKKWYYLKVFKKRGGEVNEENKDYL